MNITMIIIVVALAVFIVTGWKRGLVKTLYHMLAAFLIIGIALLVTPIASGHVKNNVKIYDTIYEKVDEKIDLPGSEPQNGEEYVKSLELPSVIESIVLEATGKVQDTISESRQGMENYIVAQFTSIVITVLTFIVVLILAAILVFILFRALDLLSKLPGVNSVNSLAGALLGLVKGVIIVWVILGILPAAATSGLGQSIIADVRESAILSFMYDHNLLSEFAKGNLTTDISKIVDLLKNKRV